MDRIRSKPYVVKTADARSNDRPEIKIYPTVIAILNTALADEFVLSVKTRNANWNVYGAVFYSKRTLFEIQYKKLNNIYDEIFKRILELGGKPFGSFEEYIHNTRLKESPRVIPDLMDLITDHEVMARYLNEDALICSERYEDKVTRNLLEEILGLHEKMALTMRSILDQEFSNSER